MSTNRVALSLSINGFLLAIITTAACILAGIAVAINLVLTKEISWTSLNIFLFFGSIMLGCICAQLHRTEVGLAKADLWPEFLVGLLASLLGYSIAIGSFLLYQAITSPIL